MQQYSLRSKAVHIKNNIFGIPTFGEPVDGKDPIDYNYPYLTICPNCNFTAPGDEFFKFSQEDEPSFDVSKFSEKWNTEKAELQKQILDESKINSKYKQLHNVEAKLENTCSKHKKDLEFFETHNDCPTCQQAIDEAFKSTMIDKKKNKIIQ